MALVWMLKSPKANSLGTPNSHLIPGQPALIGRLLGSEVASTPQTIPPCHAHLAQGTDIPGLTAAELVFQRAPSYSGKWQQSHLLAPTWGWCWTPKPVGQMRERLTSCFCPLWYRPGQSNSLSRLKSWVRRVLLLIDLALINMILRLVERSVWQPLMIQVGRRVERGAGQTCQTPLPHDWLLLGES